MVHLRNVEEFFRQPAIAVVGVSRNSRKFGNAIYRTLKAKGCTVFPVNPHTDTLEGDRCYRALSSLPVKVNAVVLSAAPAASEAAVHEAIALGVRNIWFQQGAESETAIKYCKEQGANVIAGECILMFAEPVDSIHRVHRWVWRVLGKTPAHA